MPAGPAGMARTCRVNSENHDVQGCTNAVGGTTPWMEEVEQRREQLPRMPGAAKDFLLLRRHRGVDPCGDDSPMGYVHTFVPPQ